MGNNKIARGYSCRSVYSTLRWCERSFTTPTNFWAVAATGYYTAVVLPEVPATAPHLVLAKPVPIAATGYSSGPKTSTSLSMPPQPTTPSSTLEPTQPSRDTGLTRGAKIGIGVGVPLGLLLFVAGVVFFYIRHRTSTSRVAHPSRTPPPAYYEAKPELDGSSPVQWHPAELEIRSVANNSYPPQNQDRTELPTALPNHPVPASISRKPLPTMPK